MSSQNDPLEQKQVSDLIHAGYVVDLVLQHEVNELDQNQFFLYAKYRSNMRPIYTQRNAHRSYTNLERAVDWGKRMGFRQVSVTIDYSSYLEPGEE